MNKHIIKIKELIQDQVDMGTFGLVELELLEMEKELNTKKYLKLNIDSYNILIVNEHKNIVSIEDVLNADLYILNNIVKKSAPTLDYRINMTVNEEDISEIINGKLQYI